MGIAGLVVVGLGIVVLGALGYVRIRANAAHPGGLTTPDAPSGVEVAPRDATSDPDLMEEIVRAFARNAMLLGLEHEAMVEQIDRMAAVLRFCRYGTERIGKYDFTIEEFAKGLQAVADRLGKTRIPGLPFTFDASKLNVQTVQALQAVALGFSRDVSPKSDLIVSIEAGVGAVNPAAVIAWFGAKYVLLPRLKTGLAVYVVGQLLKFFYEGLEEQGQPEVAAAIVDRNRHKGKIWQLAFSDDVLLTAGKDKRWTAARIERNAGRLTSSPMLETAEKNDVNCIRLSRAHRALVWGNDDGEVCLARLDAESMAVADTVRVELGGWVMDLAPAWERGSIVAARSNGIVAVLEPGEDGALRLRPALDDFKGFERARLSICEKTRTVALWDPEGTNVRLLQLDDAVAAGIRAGERFEVTSSPLALQIDPYDQLHFVSRAGERLVYNRSGQQLEVRDLAIGEPSAAAFHSALETVYAVAAKDRIYVYGPGELPMFGCTLPDDHGKVVALAFDDDHRLAAGTDNGQVLVFELQGLRRKALAARAPLLERVAAQRALR